MTLDDQTQQTLNAEPEPEPEPEPDDIATGATMVTIVTTETAPATVTLDPLTSAAPVIAGIAYGGFLPAQPGVLYTPLDPSVPTETDAPTPGHATTQTAHPRASTVSPPTTADSLGSA